MFLRRPFWVAVVGNLSRTPAAVRIYRRMRERYRASLLFLRIPFGSKILIVNDDDTQRRILERSPSVYGGPGAKVRGMSVFQPNAVTIALGKDWIRKRKFNQEAIDRSQHGDFAASIDGTVGDVTLRALGKQQDLIEWDDVSKVFGRISRQIILGHRAIEDERITEDLRKMMRRANWLVLPRKDKDLESLIKRILKYAEAQDPHSLVAHITTGESDELTIIDKCHQVPHWMFAMTDTLAETAMRALALVSLQNDLVAEIRRQPSEDRHKTLNAVISETTRLFPSSPTLGRATLVADVLGDEVIPPGVQVLALVDGWHRDGVRFPDPDRFDLSRPAGFRLQNLAFGGGRQACAGESLARRIGTLFLEQVILNFDVVVRSPRLNVESDLPYRLNPFKVQLVVTDRV